jgi:hypothetical protein
VPWCAGCDRFLSPSTVTVGGACPRCGAAVEPGRARPAPAAAPAVADEPRVDPEPDDTTVPLPWHFKLLVAAVAGYLGWRAVQGVLWLAEQL